MHEIELTGYFMQESMIETFHNFEALESTQMWQVKSIFGVFSTEHQELLNKLSSTGILCTIKIGVHVHKGYVIYFDKSRYFYIVKEQYIDKYK